MAAKKAEVELTGGEFVTEVLLQSPSELTDSKYDLSVIQQRRANKHGLTSYQALVNLIKGLIGTGVLSLPLAFQFAGLWAAVVFTILIALISIQCMHCLVDSSRFHCRRLGRPYLDYAEVAEISLLNGPQILRKFSKVGRYAVNSCIFVTQLGFCCVYLVFMADNIKAVADTYMTHKICQQAWIAIVIGPVILLCLIRHLKYLAPFSALANILYVIGLGITFQYCFRHLKPSHSLPAISSGETLPLFFGAVMFSFAVIGLVLPLENKMITPREFTRPFGVLNTGCLLVLFLYLGVGFFGYLRFGNEVADSITLNLPDHWLYQSVKLMLALAVFFTYAVQFYAPMEVAATFIQAKFNHLGPKRVLLVEYLVKLLLILFTFAMAEAIPHLGLFISLVGSLSSAALAMIFPPIIELLTLPTVDWGRFYWKAWRNAFMCLCGFLGFVTGTFSSLKDIIAKFY